MAIDSLHKKPKKNLRAPPPPPTLVLIPTAFPMGPGQKVELVFGSDFKVGVAVWNLSIRRQGLPHKVLKRGASPRVEKHGWPCARTRLVLTSFAAGILVSESHSIDVTTKKEVEKEYHGQRRKKTHIE